MYEAKQHKSKVSRTIGGGTGVRQRVKLENEGLKKVNFMQLMWNGYSDSEYTPPATDAPPDYKDIAQTAYDFNHSGLNGKVKVFPRNGHGPFLWWEPMARRDIYYNFHLRGSRNKDNSALGEENNYTWHHCGDWQSGGDYGFGICTMQQVDAGEHNSFGHTGAVQQYVEATRNTYV